MSKSSNYVSKMPNEQGIIDWTSEENSIWAALYQRQLSCIDGRVCDEYMHGLELLNLPKDRVPQLDEVNEVLMRETGWRCAQVPALIPFDEFFRLLANKQFPVATFIRSEEEFDYLQEPDVFHEIFGHCPLLTNPAFAEFTYQYGKLGYKASREQRIYLARLYWFTVEFGLLQTEQGLKIYGGGIISSPGETQYSLDSDKPLRKSLEALDTMRTPYRIDIMQPVYFILENMNDLFDISRMDLLGLVEKAKSLGLHEPLFEPKQKKAS